MFATQLAIYSVNQTYIRVQGFLDFTPFFLQNISFRIIFIMLRFVIVIIVMTAICESEMASNQDMDKVREIEMILNRDIRAPFNGMRGKKDGSGSFGVFRNKVYLLSMSILQL